MYVGVALMCLRAKYADSYYGDSCVHLLMPLVSHWADHKKFDSTIMRDRWLQLLSSQKLMAQ